MTYSPTHSSGRGILATLFGITLFVLAPVLSSSMHPDAAGAASSVGAYGWPVAPFDRQHPVRGVLGDPRTIYHGPPTNATLYRGSGSFSFHMGVDICAADGTRVYAVADGVVSRFGPDKVIVDSGGGNRFEYWHIRPSVSVGQHVTARRTVLGRILPGALHVHLTEIDAGRITNPLLPGHLTPYRDTLCRPSRRSGSSAVTRLGRSRRTSFAAAPPWSLRPTTPRRFRCPGSGATCRSSRAG